MNGIAMNFVSDEEDPDLAQRVLKRRVGSDGNVVVGIQQPLMAVLPSLLFDGAVAFLFISSFISKNGSDGLSIFAEGFTGFGQLFQLFPLVFGAYYAASALRKVVDLIQSSK